MMQTIVRHSSLRSVGNKAPIVALPWTTALSVSEFYTAYAFPPSEACGSVASAEEFPMFCTMSFRPVGPLAIVRELVSEARVLKLWATVGNA